ncbi:MAG: hypothetical protein P1R58_00015 [bacterium]|nr:hypothetical protein [bacterium]
MKYSIAQKSLLAISLALLISCSKTSELDISQQSVPSVPLLQCTAAERMPESIEAIEAVRLGEPRTILPDSATAYVGESANLYRYYHFVGLATTKYLIGSDTIEFELAQFETDVDAFGFATSFRTNGAEYQGVGTASFMIGKSFYATIADFVLTAAPLTETENSATRTAELVREISNLMEATPPPAWYTFFPSRDQVSQSARYYSYDYLGVNGLNKVYTIDYVAGEDTATFFLVPDTSGQKFERLKILAESTERAIGSPKRMPYDTGLGMAFEHPDLGIIIFGVKQKKILGVIGYDPRQIESLVRGWIEGFK